MAQVHPGLQSHEAFIREIANKKWECSYTSYPELRFHENKIEILAGDERVTSELTKVSHPEPGIIRVDYESGDMTLFTFSDDLQTFVVAYMEEISEFTVPGAAAPQKLPSTTADKPVEIEFKDHPYWKKSRLHADKMEVLDESGVPFATNQSIGYLPHVQGIILPEKTVGAVIMSRKSPGGWYLRGHNVGTGVRTEKSGYFRPFLASKLENFPLRSAHFNHPLLLAGFDQLASAQERYSIQLAIDNYGETSAQVASCYHEMGKLRGYARSYMGAPGLLKQGFDHLQKNYADDKTRILEYGTDLAEAQCDAGEFSAAKATLSGIYTLLSPAGGEVRSRFFFFKALGTAEFGLRAYPQAAQHFQSNLKLTTDAGLKFDAIQCLLDIIPCHLAQNQLGPASATLKQCMAVQDQMTTESKNRNFDTWKLAFACVAMGETESAIKYAPTRPRRNSVTYEEYGRLVSLFHGGDRPGAQKLAKEFMGRFQNIAEINIRDDIDPITVKLTQAIADPSPANVTALEQLWATQVESLRNRPLKNYLFARVMVVTLNKLKSGR
ncbi:hypothetical protein FEM03_12035 [Phragmitibacter flavus]|uniref:Tetratricopeptide repeat protein n=1 Tax=Phragmitibacter flavus TaxID=2576071 RepID=A0A5R8KDT5_9BACT|nr:hypothetical protein [Phragmitibacter flavus]TLD70451.1 hypothetical protein FEM03_12035 [Phragmitibacter flavus]